MKFVDIRVVVLTCFLLFAAPLYAQGKTDVIVMKNGDRLTCEIKGLEAGVLYVKLDYVDGTTSVQWSKVARLESSRLFIVKTESGSSYTGKLSTAGAPGLPGDQPTRIEVATTPEEKVVVDNSEVVTIAQTSEKFWQRFSGDISTGIIYSKGNQSTQYNLSSSVAYPRERWAAALSFNSSLSSSTGSTTSTRNQVNFSAHRFLRWNNYFYSGLGSFLQSSEQGINRQTTLGGGLGYQLKNTNRSKISVIGGLAWQRTKYDETTRTDLTTENVATAMMALNVRVFKFKKTKLNFAAVAFPAISEPGRVFFKTDGSYYIKLFSNLSWNFSFYGNWDNRPPGTLSGSDYGTSSGLSWTFGSK